MEFLPVILTFIGAYGLFLFLAYLLARVFFPTIDMHGSDEKPRKARGREKTFIPIGKDPLEI